jgi:predicted neutral ceramidase superfamily lipid hydrolase
MNGSQEADPRLVIIRRMQERADIYRSVSGMVSLLAGTLSLIAAAFLLWTLRSSGSRAIDSNLFLGVWGLVLILTVAAALILLKAKNRREHPDSRLLSEVTRFALETVMPHAAIAIALGLLLSWRGSAFSLSILWVTLYGLALCATHPFAPRSLVKLGKAFLVTGISLMLFVYFQIRFLIGYDRSDSQTLLIMGVTFGLYHLLYGIETCKRAKRAK